MEQPFHSSAELARNSQQDLGPNFDFATLHIGQIGLADANAISEFLLSHMSNPRSSRTRRPAAVRPRRKTP